MARRWWTLPLFLVSALAPSFSLAGPAFENTAIVRTIELGGSLVHVSTTYAVKALEPGQTTYQIALSKAERAKTSWLEAKVKARLHLSSSARMSPGVAEYLLSISLPKALAVNGTLNLVLETMQTHATRPFPEQAAQNEPQLLKYETDLFTISPYTTLVQRTKIKSIAPNVISYTTPHDVDSFVRDGSVTRSGGTITYGPYHDIQTDTDFVAKHQQSVSVHYSFDYPVIEVETLHRTAEISHWGSNLNIEDKAHLHNAGPTLKGHFSRLEYQSQNFQRKQAPHILSDFTLHLPPGVTNAYFYDQNGNVSTSHLRTAPSVAKGSKAVQYSVLQLRPRYPVLGGWNYSYTIGFDTPLQDSVSYDAKDGVYMVGVPVMTPIPGTVVNDAEVKIILPEGATNVKFVSPFPEISNSMSTHISYLDTVGRPAVTFTYKNLTYKHTDNIYVSYQVPLSAHLKKVLSVSAAFFSLFAFAFMARRVNLNLHKK
ncbi:Ribophorin I [Suillus fuscotomentosus]|uniref:Dolichyl-diphosphooligosaccharide--protein glycosyltransferase subunit 1 n=1 Tax=Suillus fuscotomentosus TaxID=1912939 RepID=A0AAD4EJ70_9AGAM|nr:Ribophorin I [Suillus fuscotomentosus]KAG1907193.1 Ribophorin I [Suillus fuscotomentosus]